MSRILILMVISLLMTACKSEKPVGCELLSGFPDDEPGIRLGVSACFAGAVGNQLVMAGGCNFPEVPAADGGRKRYYQGIYAAEMTGGQELLWHRIGTLPVPAAYGVSITVPDGIVCIGGNNEQESLDTVFKIRLVDDHAVIEPLPSLPQPLDNFTGSLKGRRIDVYGGDKWYYLNLDSAESGWQQGTPPSFPHQRVQPVSGHVDGDFCVWGGFTPKNDSEPARLQMNGLQCMEPEKALPPPVTPDGEEIFLGGAAAIDISPDGILAVGGVNKDIFLEALNNPQEGYMTHPAEWYRFNPYILLYNKDSGWRVLGRSEHTARAGAALVATGKQVYVIGGELKPGIRTPNVCRIILP